MSFSKDSNFNSKANFTEVTFGENKPVLEVELNELQDIQNQHRKESIIDFTRDGFDKLTNVEVTNSGVKFLEETILYVQGMRCTIPSNTLIALPSFSKRKKSATINNINIEVWEDLVFADQTLTEYGGEGNNEIPNHIKDSRYPVETTRRRGVKYKFVIDSTQTTSKVPNTNSTTRYEKDGKCIYSLPLFTVNRTTDSVSFIDNRNLHQISSNTKAIEELLDESPIWKDVTGEKNITIENSLEGFTKDLVIKGRTLQNLGTKKNAHRGSSTVAIPNFFALSKTNTQYTFIINVKRKVGTNLDGSVLRINYENNTSWQPNTNFSFPLGVSTFLMPPNQSKAKDGWVIWYRNPQEDWEIDFEYTILEGDWTNEPVPEYFEGIKSVGEENKNNILLKDGSQHDSIMSSGEAEGNKIIVKSCGKNLFNINGNINERYPNILMGGKNIVDGNNVVINSNSGGTGGVGYKMTGLKGKTLTFSAKCLSVGSGTNAMIAIHYPTKMNIKLASIGLNNSNKITHTFTEDECIFSFVTEKGGGSIVTDVQLEEGTIATDYEEYKFDKKEILLPFEGGLKEWDLVKYDVGIIEERSGKRILTGTLRKISENENFSYFSIQVIDNIKENWGNPTFKCNNFKPYQNGSPESKTSESISFGGNGAKTCEINISKSKANTVDEMIAWLKANPTTVVYQLATPIIHNIEKMSLHTFEGATHIMQDNNICGEITCQAPADRDASIKSNTLAIRNTEQKIKDLASYVPTWQRYEGEGYFTLEDSFDGAVKDMTIKGKTLKNEISNNTLTTNSSPLPLTNWTLQGQSKYYGSRWNATLKDNTEYTVVINISKNTLVTQGNAFELIRTQNTGAPSQWIKSGEVGLFKKKFITNKNNAEKWDDNFYEFTVNITCTAGEITVAYAYVLEGDWTNKPVPEYFEGIKSVGENEENKIIVKSCGKNLWNYILQTGSISSSEGTEVYVQDRSRTDFIECNKYKTLTFSPSSMFGRVHFYDDNRQWLGLNVASNENTFNVPSNAKYFRIVLLSAKNEVTYVQLEQGTTTSEYENYIEDKKEILLPFEGGLKEWDSVNGEVGLIEEKSAIKVYQGSMHENWSYNVKFSEGEYLVCGIVLSNRDNNSIGVSDEFKYKNVAATPVIEEAMWFERGNKTIYISIAKSKLETPDVTGFKKWLQSNPTTVYYELDTPIIHNIERVRPVTFDRKTHIIQDNAITGETNFEAQVSLRTQNNLLQRSNVKLLEDSKMIKSDTVVLAKAMKSIFEPMLTPENEEEGAPNPVLMELQDIINRLS